MKKRIIILLFLCITALISSGFVIAHDFFISITSVDFNSTSHKLEITQQLTAHDVEKAILKSSNIDLNIAEKNEHPKCDSIIFSYLQSTFEIEGIKLNWIGKEFNLDESLWIYLESDSIQKPNSIQVNNSMLTETFELQSNITHVNFLGEQQTHSFNKLATKHTYSKK